MSIYLEVLIFVFLIFWSAEDLCTGRVGWPAMAVLGILGGTVRILTEKASFIQLFSGLIPALFLIPLSCAGERYIGGGDVLCFLVCGAYIGFTGTFELMLLAFAMAGIWGLFLLFVRRKNRHAGFPFFPFILAAQGIRLLLMFFRDK